MHIIEGFFAALDAEQYPVPSQRSGKVSRGSLVSCPDHLLCVYTRGDAGFYAKCADFACMAAVSLACVLCTFQVVKADSVDVPSVRLTT